MERHAAKSDRFWYVLTHDPLDSAAVSSFLTVPEAGAVNLFVGTTRQWTDGRETIQLSYECFASMALREMQRIGDAVAARWGTCRVAIHHRLGVVPVAEASVILGASSPHRGAAFEACRYLIDTLKVDVPIWKKEHFADGSTEWVQSGG